MSLVTVEVLDKVGILTLNNTQKLNALSSKLVEDIVEALGNFQKEQIHIVILRAPEGAKVWSAGHDVKELPLKLRDPLSYYDSLEVLLRTVEEYPGPVIAMVHGSVWGGACDLIMTCDMVIADKTAKFAMTPAKLGVPYNSTGILHFMNRLPINIAKEMFFTAELMSSERALNVGIINHLVEEEELLPFTLNMAQTISTRSILSIQVIKEQFRVLSKAYSITPSAFERVQGMRRKVYDSHDYEEAITAFLEKRPAKFKGE
ncbi:methylmalonyl-CoA decarboxylase [uncultured Anaeromusa sp.]|uniref:methylmalonyl-CoA decarboxylase n=1 Tax=uncultured Anaeromusa sp. TaxID=673273 RepID=UPI0029C970A4|nr:methylmalonyl-CoA decarboxylase [uncultured Anaeromusa sp.]